MNIIWNKVTWYSKLLAALFFIFVVPALTFYIGKQYEQTKDALKSAGVQTIPIDRDGIEPMVASPSNSKTNAGSGIFGSAMIANEPFKGFISVRTSKGKPVTTTKIRENGRFFLLLEPGSYELNAVSNDPMPSTEPTDIAVEKNVIAKVIIQLGNSLK